MSAAICAIVPTRNRAKLARNAVRSLLDQDVPVEICLSDNSASPDRLRRFCAGRSGLHYLRPPAELSMPEHWDWAIRQAMEQSAATHFTVHYDRKFTKPDEIGRLAAFASSWPDRLISFPVDHIGDQPPPLRLWQPPWTGRLFSIGTARVAGLLAAGQVTDIAHALPILSNCLVPRSILQRIVDRFGDVCSSTGPDSAFMARFLALDDLYLHYDRPIGILYGSRRSNGLGYLRGKGGDFADYVKMFGGRPWLDAAPLPGVNLGQNMLYHEYELVRRLTGDRLPPLDPGSVLDDLGAQLRWVEDEKRKRNLRAVLREAGWTGGDPPPLHRRSWREVRDQMICRYHMKRHGFVPPTITGFAFLSDRRALKYALAFPRQRQEGWEHLALLRPEAAG